jgi:hypothetical protein
MKSSLRSRQEPRRVSNGVIIGAMLLSLCILSIVKARYCATPFGASRACAACVRACVCSSPLISSLSFVCLEMVMGTAADAAVVWFVQARPRTSSRSR